jgi:hypothetical protein
MINAVTLPTKTVREIPMLKALFGLVTVIFVAGSSLACAQDTSVPRLSPTDAKILTDARIGILKAALQLTPEQAKYWPAVEEAIRDRAQTRYKRIAAFAATAEQVRQGHQVDPIDLLRSRADALAQRANELKNLANVWQPLYQSLDADQKERVRVLARLVIRQMRDAVDTRRMEMYDEEGDEG